MQCFKQATLHYILESTSTNGRHITQLISDFKVIRDKNQFWIHFSASGFIQRRNVDICLKMGHIIPDGDSLQQPTNAADTSLYIQRLFIGADCAASKARSEQTGRETAYGGILQIPECLKMWITSCSVLSLFMFLVRLRCKVSTWRHSNCLDAAFAHSSAAMWGKAVRI